MQNLTFDMIIYYLGFISSVITIIGFLYSIKRKQVKELRKSETIRSTSTNVHGDDNNVNIINGDNNQQASGNIYNNYFTYLINEPARKSQEIKYYEEKQSSNSNRGSNNSQSTNSSEENVFLVLLGGAILLIILLSISTSYNTYFRNNLLLTLFALPFSVFGLTHIYIIFKKLLFKLGKKKFMIFDYKKSILYFIFGEVILIVTSFLDSIFTNMSPTYQETVTQLKQVNIFKDFSSLEAIRKNFSDGFTIYNNFITSKGSSLDLLFYIIPTILILVSVVLLVSSGASYRTFIKKEIS